MAPNSFLVLLVSFLSVFTSSRATDMVELDPIFPRNETYAPLRYFPLAWGLQNAQTAYPYGFKIYWRLSLADSAKFIRQGDGIFPPEDERTGSFSEAPAPSDPVIFHDFPIQLMNFSTGHWELEWRFGFEHNCSLTDPGTPSEHYSQQPWQSLVFAIAEGGKTVDLEERSCASENAVAFKVSEPHYNEYDQTCPVVEQAVPDPCSLEFTAEAAENITAAAREMGGCESGDLAAIPVTCDNSALRASGWWSRLVLLGISWSVML